MTNGEKDISILLKCEGDTHPFHCVISGEICLRNLFVVISKIENHSSCLRALGLELRTHNTQQTYNFASMQAQLSELQKMFCKLSESLNVNKNRVEP